MSKISNVRKPPRRAQIRFQTHLGIRSAPQDVETDTAHSHDWYSITGSHKLEQLSLAGLRKALDHAPEVFDEWVVRVVWEFVLGGCFEFGHIDSWLAFDGLLKSFGGKDLRIGELAVLH
jgi:hypothetical protein